MAKKSSLVFLVVFALCFGVSSAANCLPYDGTLCAGLIPAGTLVLPQVATVLITENFLETTLGFTNLTLVGGAIDPVCLRAALNYACGFAFQKCTWNPATNQTGSIRLFFFFSS